MATTDFNPKDSREGYVLKYIYGSAQAIYVYTNEAEMQVHNSWSTAFGAGYWTNTYLGFDTSSLAGETISSATLKLHMYDSSSSTGGTIYFYVGQNVLHDPLSKLDYSAYLGMTQFDSVSIPSLSNSSSSPTLVEKSVDPSEINTTGWTDFGLHNPQTGTSSTYSYDVRVFSVNSSDTNLWPVLEVVTATGQRRIFHAVHR